MNDLDDPRRYHDIRGRIHGKWALESLYREVYAKYAACVVRCPSTGGVLEVGSGGGFAQELLPDLLASDILAYPGLDLVLDARQLPFRTGALRAVLMFNVFHHIPDVAAFLAECERVLRPRGRVLIVDQHPGVIGAPILRYLHHEPYTPEAASWTFQSSGPLSRANGALCWMVFRRDRAEFETQFRRLSLERYEPHTPLRYWLSGGLKRWTLLPRVLYPAATALDCALAAAWPDTGSFVDVELVRRPD
jgi:SAM-dependent methyltransferase